MRAVALASAVFWAACGFGGDYGGTMYRCGAGDRCPDGQICVDGYCVPGAIDAGGDGGGPGSVCGSLWLLQDDFDDDAAWPEFEPWFDPGVTVSEGGGQLQITVPAGSGDPYGGYQSPHQYDATEGGLEAEVAELGGTNTVLEVRSHLQEKAQLVWEDGQIAARVFGTADPGERAHLTYDPSWVHWRIRSSAGVMHWEVSADRTDWTEVHAESNPIEVDHVIAVLAAGGQGATDTTARFESVNTQSPTSPGYCSGDTLVDDFATGLPPLWYPYDNGDCTVGEAGGQLTMTFSGTGSMFCGLVSRHYYDLTDSALVIDTAGTPIRTNFVTYFQLVSPLTEETRVELSNDGGTLYAVDRINGVQDPIVSKTYDATDDRFWRIRGVGAEVELATAPAATGPWTPQLTATPGFSLGRVVVNLGAGHYATVSPAGAVTVDVPGVNAP